jgi:ELWxxDGT repeat protein
VLELLPGNASNYVSGGFLALGDGRALFAASNGSEGTELWVTDGTDAGTALVKDINPGPTGSYPGVSGVRGMISLGDGRALFGAEDSLHGRELWISDGTEAGTTLLADLAPGTISYYPGSSESPASGNPANFTALAPGRILFTASDPEHGNELWITDATAEGTHLVADLWPGNAIPYSGANPAANSSSPGQILPLGNGRALVSADDGVHGREFWVTDGTAEGTSLLADIWPGGGSGNPGSATATYTPYPPPASPGAPGGSLALDNGTALFSATDPVHGNELWITDGTAEGTRLLENITRGMQGFANSTPSYFAALGDGRVVFSADDGVNGIEPWVTDGTAAGTHLLSNIFPGAAGSGAQGFLLL